jgi:hypothetical protein
MVPMWQSWLQRESQNSGASELVFVEPTDSSLRTRPGWIALIFPINFSFSKAKNKERRYDMLIVFFAHGLYLVLKTVVIVFE